MTKSPLPEITLTCADGHTFTTRAAGGRSVRCKVCGRSKRVPSDRPTTARAAAAYVAPGSTGPDGDDHQDQEPAEPEPGRELADRWQREAPWSDSIEAAPGRPADECPECEGPLSWEPRRTLAYCPECKSIDVPPAVRAHVARQQAERAIVAVRSGGTVADPAAERKERVRFQALRKRKIEQLEEDWIETLGNPDAYDRSQWKREARDFAATLREWIRELKEADTEDKLNDIWRDMFAEVIQSQPGKELRAEYDAALNRAEQAEQRRQYAEQMAEYEAEREAEAERQQAEYERQERERQRELRKPATPRAITAGSTTTGSPADAIIMGAALIEQIRKQRANKAAKIERNGKCDFCRKPTPATRAYGVGYQQNGWGRGSNELVLALDRPHARACSKHHEQAGKQVGQQNAGVKTYYWELG